MKKKFFLLIFFHKKFSFKYFGHLEKKILLIFIFQKNFFLNKIFIFFKICNLKTHFFGGAFGAAEYLIIRGGVVVDFAPEFLAPVARLPDCFWIDGDQLYYMGLVLRATLWHPSHNSYSPGDSSSPLNCIGVSSVQHTLTVLNTSQLGTNFLN